ncbi:MAG: hypothetical protein WC662_04495 [Candidatus Paceibacterota bacterium]|jgi:hypothetical protein
MKNKIYIRKKAFWLSKNGKIWCIGEYIIFQALALSFVGLYLYFISTGNPNSSIVVGCLAPVFLLMCASLAGIIYYKSHVWTCLVVWIFFKPNIKDIRKALLDKRVRYEYIKVRGKRPLYDYYKKVAVEY